MAKIENETENEKTGSSWRRREITDKQQESRDKLRKAMADAGVSGFLTGAGAKSAMSATSKAAHRHVENKSADKSQSRSSDAGQSLGL
ncbi:hypothetical protein [Williamsia muralis]|uniref:hypothetical protein n=1 Tax=Williamsia marianensis TaxID=85044 RepID=UPI000DE78D78|nr:hypothetical protein [Williamsia marianensis]PVY22512.1 hypothetical protein C7458_12913 [Williamsia marianensis]